MIRAFTSIFLSFLLFLSFTITAQEMGPSNWDELSTWDKIWKPAGKNGNGEDYFLIEAEDLINAESSNEWEIGTSDKGRSSGCPSGHHCPWFGDKGYHGEGYVKYIGPPRGVGLGHYDATGDFQGTEENRLYVPVMIEEPGTYWVELNAYHTQEDGDNDIWVNKLPFNFMTDGALERNCDQHHPHYWSTDNAARDPRECEKGLNVWYIAGRSSNYRVDWIQLFHFDGQKREPGASTDSDGFKKARNARMEDDPVFSELYDVTGLQDETAQRAVSGRESSAITISAAGDIKLNGIDADEIVVYSLDGSIEHFDLAQHQGSISLHRPAGLQIIVATKNDAVVARRRIITSR
jgi:hypothetical protein